MRLQGKVAVITGAGSGLGRAQAILFSEEGASILASDWNEETLDETVALVREAGGQITGLQGNVADQAEAEEMVDKAVETYGRVDILCNNAGVMCLNQGVGELANEVWRRVMGINLDGTVFTSRRAVQHMLKQGGGSIINIASVAGMGGAVHGVAYTVSKHAVIGLTKNTAWMYAKKGIRCNAICPGGVKTHITTSVDMLQMDPEGYERIKEYYPTMPGALESVDIAQMALFLASDESRYINGAIIPADRGWRAA